MLTTVRIIKHLFSLYKHLKVTKILQITLRRFVNFDPDFMIGKKCKHTTTEEQQIKLNIKPFISITLDQTWLCLLLFNV